MEYPLIRKNGANFGPNLTLTETNIYIPKRRNNLLFSIVFVFSIVQIVGVHILNLKIDCYLVK